MDHWQYAGRDSSSPFRSSSPFNPSSPPDFPRTPRNLIFIPRGSSPMAQVKSEIDDDPPLDESAHLHNHGYGVPENARYGSVSSVLTDDDRYDDDDDKDIDEYDEKNHGVSSDVIDAADGGENDDSSEKMGDIGSVYGDVGESVDDEEYHTSESDSLDYGAQRSASGDVNDVAKDEDEDDIALGNEDAEAIRYQEEDNELGETDGVNEMEDDDEADDGDNRHLFDDIDSDFREGSTEYSDSDQDSDQSERSLAKPSASLKRRIALRRIVSSSVGSSDQEDEDGTEDEYTDHASIVPALDHSSVRITVWSSDAEESDQDEQSEENAILVRKDDVKDSSEDEGPEVLGLRGQYIDANAKSTTPSDDAKGSSSSMIMDQSVKGRVDKVALEIIKKSIIAALENPIDSIKEQVDSSESPTMTSSRQSTDHVSHAAHPDTETAVDAEQITGSVDVVDCQQVTSIPTTLPAQAHQVPTVEAHSIEPVEESYLETEGDIASHPSTPTTAPSAPLHRQASGVAGEYEAEIITTEDENFSESMFPTISYEQLEQLAAEVPELIGGGVFRPDDEFVDLSSSPSSSTITSLGPITPPPSLKRAYPFGTDEAVDSESSSVKIKTEQEMEKEKEKEKEKEEETRVVEGKEVFRRRLAALDDDQIERPMKMRKLVRNVGLVVLGAALGSVGTIAGLMQLAPEA